MSVHHYKQHLSHYIKTFDGLPFQKILIIEALNYLVTLVTSAGLAKRDGRSAEYSVPSQCSIVKCELRHEKQKQYVSAECVFFSRFLSVLALDKWSVIRVLWDITFLFWKHWPASCTFWNFNQKNFHKGITGLFQVFKVACHSYIGKYSRLFNTHFNRVDVCWHKDLNPNTQTKVSSL